MFSKRLTFSLGLAIIALLAALPATAQSCTPSTTKSRVTYSLHNPVTQTLYDVCTQRPGYDPVNNPDPYAQITLSGEFFYEYSCVTKPNGDYHVEWTSHYNLTGVKNGVKYVGKDTQTYDLKMDPDGSFPPVPTSDFRTTDSFRLIAQGPTPDEIMTQKTHVKVNAAGVVTVDQEGPPVVKCVGGGGGCGH
jgi:hypothetical protein